MASISVYSLRDDGYKYVSKDFRVREFACKDGSDYILICRETAQILQSVRDYFGKPVSITSAYRTPRHNKKVGGATNSQHVKGTACDIQVKDVPSWAVAAYLEAKYPTHGIGYYNTFTHIDSRGYKSYWRDKGQGSVSVSTFGLGKKYEQYKAEDEMTIEEIKNLLLKDESFCIKVAETYADKQRKAAAGTWSEPARSWALKNGVFNDDKDWKAPLTREQAAQVFYNQHQRDTDDGK